MAVETAIYSLSQASDVYLFLLPVPCYIPNLSFIN